MDTIKATEEFTKLAVISGGGVVNSPRGKITKNGISAGFVVGRIFGKDLSKLYSKIKNDTSKTKRQLYFYKISPYIKNEGFSVYYALLDFNKSVE